MSKQQKKLVLQPNLKEKLLFEDYNVGFLIPEGADLRAPYLTENNYFPIKSTTIKENKKLRNTLYNTKIFLNMVIHDLRNPTN